MNFAGMHRMLLPRLGAGLSVLLLAACDLRTTPDSHGDIPYAKLKNTYTDMGGGPAACPPVLGCPARGIITSSASFGAGGALVFDVDTGTLSQVSYGHLWGSPETGRSGQTPTKQSAILTQAERNQLVRLANFAWAPSLNFPPTHDPMDVFLDVTLIDGKHTKLLDGFDAGAKLYAAMNKAAQAHGVGR
jgi:hypothetical protein